MSLNTFLDGDQFTCSICLDIFNNPSSTPCGHSFCVTCINQYWDGAKECQCPLCKRTFQKRPDLQINRTLREITEQYRSMSAGHGALAKDKKVRVQDGAMPSDLINELTKRLPRVPPKTYLNSRELVTTPMASSVPNQSPISVASGASEELPAIALPSQLFGRRRFTMSGVASSANIPICQIHQRGIMIICLTDGEYICPDCEAEEHSSHDTVKVEDVWIEKQAQLKETEQKIQEMIQQRLQKIEEVRISVANMKLAVEQETASSVCIFSELVAAIERSQADLIDSMEVNRKTSEQLADTMVQQLEQEVKELQQRERAVAKLSTSDDYVQGIKSFPGICSIPPTKDWSGVSVASDLGTSAIYKSLAAQVDKFQERLRSVTETGFIASLLEASPTRPQPRMRRVQEYSTDVTLDSNTAHPRLILSDSMKSVRCGDRYQLVPDNTDRFDRVVCVLGREAISSGRHYWEVLVGGKTDWDLGVARQSSNRKGKIDVTPSNGYWFLSLRDKNKYAFRTEPSTDVHLNLRPNKIGIFVDYERGQVSFYNVDAKIHIYTFNDNFTECILPFFSPCTNKSGKNDGPLVITPVDKSD
ncbi:E3 ubiquitin-protein ligase TRIM39 [Nerophis lumbriciformis]|uniref:E3 ubiquitin-protein ligase TRIM39 n=1 Tax=Nerophis lumbriciformis TaxID=546530 RepID=UPI002AE00843|nr:E3 ubiquitin-protein ligase TRIM39-like [Nerophis lumbriciformis]